eukprot:3369998-Pyramimonas_sp.AAC.1
MKQTKIDPDILSYNAGISACEKAEQWQQALSLLVEMWEIIVEPDVSSYTKLSQPRAGRAYSL